MAGRRIGTGFIEVQGRNSGFKKSNDESIKALNKTKRAINRQAKAMRALNRRVTRFTQSLKSAATGLIAFAGIRGVKNLVSDMAEFGATLFEASARLGVNTDMLQKWRRAFEGEGGSAEGADKALNKLTKAIAESRSEIEKGLFATGTYSENFRQLGISADEVVNLSLDQMLSRISDGMAGMSDQTNKAAVGMELFGQRGQAAINVLQDGSDTFEATLDHMGRLGTISTDQAKSLKDLAQEMTDFGTAVRNAFAKVIADRADQIRQIIEKMTAAAVKLSDAFAFFIDHVAPRLKSYFIGFAAVIGVKMVLAFKAAIVAVGGFRAALVLLKGAMIRTGLLAIPVILGEIIYWTNKGVQALGGWRRTFKLVFEFMEQTVRKISALFVALYYKIKESWHETRIITLTLTAKMVEAFLSFVNDSSRYLKGWAGGVKGIFVNVKDTVVGIFQGEWKFDLKKAWKEGFDEAYNAAEDIVSERAVRLRKHIADQRKKSNEAAKKVDESMAIVWAPYEYSKAPNLPGLARNPFDKYYTKKTGDDGPPAPAGPPDTAGGPGDVKTWAELFPRLAATSRDIAEGITEMGKNLRDFFDNGQIQWENFRKKAFDVVDNIVNKLSDRFIWEPMTNAIADAFAKGFENAQKGEFIQGIISAFASGGSVPGKAAGGGVQGGRPYMVGERGPELFVPNSNGYIHNSNATARMGGGTTINFAPVINSNDKAAVRTEMLQMLPQFIDAAKSAVAYEGTRPGPLRTRFE